MFIFKLNIIAKHDSFENFYMVAIFIPHQMWDKLQWKSGAEWPQV